MHYDYSKLWLETSTLEVRRERQRLAGEEGAKALKEVAERSIAVRKNMLHLRALRLAREAETVRTRIEKQPASTKSKTGV